MVEHPANPRRSAAGVVALAKCDPRLVATDWPLDPALEAAVDAWIDDQCVLDPQAWLSCAEIKASLPACSAWDRAQLNAALRAHAITYRRKGNSHGYDGLRLKERVDD